MKTFSERNPFALCAIGVGLTAAVTVGALNYDKLPLINQNNDYTAYFADAAGLIVGSPVQVSGYRVGEVESLALDGPRVLVTFNVDSDIRVGDRSEAAIQTKSLLGAKLLELTPRGEGIQGTPIPLERTRTPYQLPDALGDLTSTISGLNTDQLSQSLSVLSDTFADTPPALKVAISGVGRFSETLNRRDADLRNLLENAAKVSGVLSDESDKVVSLIADANALLLQLQGESIALDQISGNITVAVQQVKGFVVENRTTFKPALEKLNGVLAIVENHKERVQLAIKKLNAYAMTLGESVSSGPFYKAYVANLLPGQFIQPFIDAAFSDLGLDPNTLSPSQRIDPPIGQPGTPPLPVPYPRTGRGGEPNMTLPDAITGNPGDQGCGPAGIPLPGPTGCYPYSEPLPAPPPGGPPPGPPAETPPSLQSAPEPTPSPVEIAPIEEGPR